MNKSGLKKSGIIKLISNYYSPKEIFYLELPKIKEFFEKHNLDEKFIEPFFKSKNLDDVLKEFDLMKKMGIEFVSSFNKIYPLKLKNISDYPIALYFKGKRIDFDAPVVAIVGARNCSTYGLNVAKKIGFELSTHNVNIISGLARGVDGAGLSGCIDAGGTPIAVMGCGVDICYPRENINIYEQIKRMGCIISEYPVKSEPCAWRFPLRNRIISGLADIIVVVEAKEKSGSLITVDYAIEQGKDVMAVPGRISDNLSKGCNKIIRDGGGIITSVNDILDTLEIIYSDKSFDKNKGFSDKKNNLRLEKEIESLYSCVDLVPKSASLIAFETGKDIEEVIQGLIKLQMMGLIEEPSKNNYVKKLL